ncbi:MAG: hypothetical protein GC192_20705 [Bacteroidetes bacterium]|nr:hypothetical protein [Bacteroidota bacterium]
MRFQIIRNLSLICLAVCLFFACGNEPSQSEANEAALPHNMEQTGNTTEAENAELAAAQGKQAMLIQPAALLATIKADTSALLVVNFWKFECLKCIYLQQVLQDIQTKHGEKKLHLMFVNMNEETKTNEVNLVIRKVGVASDVLQVNDSDGKWMNEISGGWNGALPAIFIKSKDGIKQFQTRNMSKEELEAVLEPLLL